MSTLYTNLNIQSGYPSFEQEACGQDKSFTFTTDSLEIPSSNGKTFYNAEDLLYSGVGGESAYATGLVFMAYPTNNYEDTPLVFTNQNAIVLPTNVGDTVEGILNSTEFEDNESGPVAK